MLEQEVDERLAAIAPHRRVQQIGVLVGESRIDEAAGMKRERRPVERFCQHRRNDRAQHAPGVLRMTEHAFEQRIVWSGDHRSISVGSSHASGKLVRDRRSVICLRRRREAIPGAWIRILKRSCHSDRASGPCVAVPVASEAAEVDQLAMPAAGR
jgi:hypothetical protein